MRGMERAWDSLLDARGRLSSRLMKNIFWRTSTGSDSRVENSLRKDGWDDDTGIRVCCAFVGDKIKGAVADILFPLYWFSPSFLNGWWFWLALLISSPILISLPSFVRPFFRSLDEWGRYDKGSIHSDSVSTVENRTDIGSPKPNSSRIRETSRYVIIWMTRTFTPEGKRDKIGVYTYRWYSVCPLSFLFFSSQYAPRGSSAVSLTAKDQSWNEDWEKAHAAVSKQGGDRLKFTLSVQ